MDLYIAVCDAIGKGASKLEPVRKWIDSIGKVLGHIKDIEDKARHTLPPIGDRKRLEAPRKQLPGPSEDNNSLDDEIPF